MRVVQVTPRYFPSMGGVEVVVQKISKTLVERGIQVTVFSVDRSLNLPTVENIEGVVVKRFTPIFGDPFYLPEPKFVASLRGEKGDIVHVHNIHTLPPFVAALCKRDDQKLVLQPHYHRYGQSPFRQALFQFYKRGSDSLVFPRTDIVITNSTYENNIFREDFSDARNVFLVPEGVDVDDATRFEHKPADPKRILYVGALKRYKNVDKILEGFAHLVAGGNNNYRLVIVGEGAELNSLFSLASALGVGKFVQWKSRLSRQQLLGEYAQASVLVLLSPLESFSRVVFDALVIGVPVVVLNFGAFRHLVEAGYAEGVNSLRQENIAQALLEATRKRYARLSLSSDEFLNWETYSNRIVSIYEKLAES